VVSGGGADSKLQFQLKRGGDRTKRCQKIKRSIELVLASWEESVTRRNGIGDVGRRRGGTEEGKERRRCQLG
jgi:hypothetical protein